MLIDTFSMTATLFESYRPPVALIIGGSEGGMKRTLACSYDVTTGTLYRETVLRLPSQTVDRIHSLQRVRLGLKNPYKAGDVIPVVNPEQTHPQMTQQAQSSAKTTTVTHYSQPQDFEMQQQSNWGYGGQVNANAVPNAEFNQAVTTTQANPSRWG